MLRQILIAHQSEAIRSFVRAGIEANFGDAVVFEAADSEQALGAARMLNLHLVIYSTQLEDEDILETYLQFQSTTSGLTIPFLLLTEGEAHEQYRPLLDAGAFGCLELPCTAADLSEAIVSACNPLSMRASQRYSIPQTEVQLQQPEGNFCGRVINISEGGLLCQLNEPENFGWSSKVKMALNFRVSGQRVTVTELAGVPVHLNVLQSNADYSPKQIRVAFRYVDMSSGQLKQLRQIFATLDLEQLLVPVAV